MNNTITALRAAENLQLGLLASSPEGPAREMMCSIIDEMTPPPIKRLMIIDTSNVHWGVAGPIMIYNIQDGSMTQNEIFMPIVPGVSSFNVAPIENDTFVITQGDFTMLMNIDAVLLQAIYKPKFIEIKVANSKRFSCGSEAGMVKLHDGRILLLNGSYWTGRASRRSHRIFDPEASAWIKISKSDIPNRHAYCVVMFDGRVLIAGGSSDITYGGCDKCWIFNASTRRFTDTTPMNVERVQPGGCLLSNGHVFVCGGELTCEMYDPITAEWARVGKIKHKREGPAACLINHDNIFISGGMLGRTAAPYGGECEIYNLTTHTSTVVAQKMPTDRMSSVIIPLYE